MEDVTDSTFVIRVAKKYNAQPSACTQSHHQTTAVCMIQEMV